jgi:hypothetical protein
LNKAEIKTVRLGVGLPNLRVLRIYFANALIYTTIIFTSQETARETKNCGRLSLNESAAIAHLPGVANSYG